jgi:nitrous oxidase accessory protein NosD
MLKRFLLAGALVSAFLAIGVSSASANTLFVDDDHAQCPQAVSSSIQAAVLLAAPGDTIKVCPGTYQEQVRIDGKPNLRLESLNPLQAVIKYPTAPSLPIDNYLVHVKNSNGVYIRGFTITGPFYAAGCVPPEKNNVGVFVDNSFGVDITQNWITQIKNALPELFGCQDGLAVLVGDSSLPTSGSADVDQNRIDNYQKGGVVVDNGGSWAQVDHNVIKAATDVQPFIAPNGVQISNGAGARVDHNKVSENIWLPSRVGNYAGTGILLYQPDPGGVRVDQNDVFHNNDGISSYSSDHQKIDHNNSFDQTVYDGLYFDADSTQNQVLGNDAFRNAEHDCHDDSKGNGTAGTGNYWKGDRGLTETPPGICFVKGDKDKNEHRQKPRRHHDKPWNA